MSRRGNTVRAGVLAVVALLAASCGSPGKPVDPAPVRDAGWPQPAHVGGPDATAGGGADTSCNPLASLSPSGTSVPDSSTMGEIKRRGKLIAGVDQTTYLFGFRNPTTGNLEGFDIDMVKEIAKAIFGTADGHVQFRAIPSSQREDVLKKHQVDVVVRTYSITCARKKDVQFSSVYYKAGQRILVTKESKATKLADLSGKKVCATKKSTSLAKIATDPAKPVPVSVDNWSDCLVMLQQGQVEAVSTDDTILAGMAAQDPTLQVVGDQFTEENYGIGVPKDREDMVRFVNAVLENVRNGGAWQDSYRRWVEPSLGPATPPAPQYQ
ncbi:glutamate ABC transporter substrate-binding protein [Amycolatopsis australiensis]|uniref:Amino acid ABC transporter substrate-binding protein, PAAT family n=1 Tax=Amycolatopsis australiensis TaxID=546364 RepID=A0A1K1PPG3_9PSEU|nr:glutamate ABC transporter substrate-binding protein [Amycolatopsis australiensis]SFW49363.1 amino acid ABC transporter substrate-binding protein, PAAT family [Amycolatopsis australiensis]